MIHDFSFNMQENTHLNPEFNDTSTRLQLSNVSELVKMKKQQNTASALQLFLKIDCFEFGLKWVNKTEKRFKGLGTLW